MDIRCWFHFFGQEDIQSKKAVIVESLTNAGIHTYSLDLEGPGGPGVLVFDEISQQLCHFLREVSHNGLERVIAIATSHSLLTNSAWHLLQAGVSDVFDWHHPSECASQIAARLRRWNAVDQLVESPLVRNNLIGQSPAFKSLLRQVVEIAHFTDASVLIMGETGTGKELLARLIHTLDLRRSRHDLVVLDCTTIMPELSGSEFFGHERGAFTGATAPREGAFALADGGTLFLDEVGELPLRLQSQLLRVVQEHSYKRLGSNTWRHTDFRLICATNKDLLQEVEGGEFRGDLYYRLANWVCRLPPLRERFEDILLLVRHFLQKLRPDKKPLELDAAVQDYLLRRDYPGNIRDLKQLVLRISHRHVGDGPITVGDIPEEERPKDVLPVDWQDARFEQGIRRALMLGTNLKEISQGATETAIRIAIADEEGNLQRAARRLGVTDRALQMRKANRRQGDQMQGIEQIGDSKMINR